MVMAFRENGTLEEVSQLKEVIQQLRLRSRFNVKRLDRRIVVNRPCGVSVKIKMNRFDIPNSNVTGKKIPKFRSNVLKKRIYMVN